MVTMDMLEQLLRYNTNNTNNGTMELVIYGARQFGIKTRRSRHFGNLSYGGLHEEGVRPTSHFDRQMLFPLCFWSTRDHS